MTCLNQEQRMCYFNYQNVRKRDLQAKLDQLRLGSTHTWGKSMEKDVPEACLDVHEALLRCGCICFRLSVQHEAYHTLEHLIDTVSLERRDFPKGGTKLLSQFHSFMLLNFSLLSQVGLISNQHSDDIPWMFMSVKNTRYVLE
jgi:hypothetical protein